MFPPRGLQIFQDQVDERGLAGTPLALDSHDETFVAGVFMAERTIYHLGHAGRHAVAVEEVFLFCPYRTVRFYRNIRSHVGVQNA